MLSRHTLLLTFATFVTYTFAQTCYALDGTQLDDTFAPCNSTAKISGCCATKRTVGADICLDNGLCMSTRDENVGMIWQNGCTDSTGRDVACPRICPDVTTNFGNMNPLPAWNVQQCDFGKYCCRAANDRRSCCTNATAPKVTMSTVAVLPVSLSTPSPISSQQVLATAVSTGAPFDASAAPIQDVCKKERQHTAVVGGTISGVFGAIILGLLGAMFWLHKKEKHQRRMKEHYEEQIATTSSYRRKVASSAVSLIGTEPYEEVRRKSNDG